MYESMVESMGRLSDILNVKQHEESIHSMDEWMNELKKG